MNLLSETGNSVSKNSDPSLCAWEATRKIFLPISQSQIQYTWPKFCSWLYQSLTAATVPPVLLERPGVGAGALLGAALTLHLDSLLGLVGTEPTFLSVYFITTASSIKIECEK